MMIDEIEYTLNSIKIVLEHTEKGYYPEQFKTHEECLKEIMDIVRKYQQLQADYKTHLKSDMVAMLEELNLKIDEMFVRRIDYTVDKIQDLIQEKINSLKENKK